MFKTSTVQPCYPPPLITNQQQSLAEEIDHGSVEEVL